MGDMSSLRILCVHGVLMHCSGLSVRVDLNICRPSMAYGESGQIGQYMYANFPCWYAYLYLGHTPTLTYRKGIRDELESNMLYDQSYPCSASLVISYLCF
jgi:hypothetical protein